MCDAHVGNPMPGPVNGSELGPERVPAEYLRGASCWGHCPGLHKAQGFALMYLEARVCAIFGSHNLAIC